jgi:endonuclease/exonuclease/phosphatase family metal-dependent hydrolase
VSQVRIGTLNLWGDPHDRLERLERAAGWLVAEGLDALAVQEIVPYGDGTTATRLCELSGYHHATPVRSSTGALSTCAVLTKEGGLGGEVVVLPGRGWEGASMFAAVCALPVAGEQLPVVSTHLAWGSLNEALRLEQAQWLVRYFDEKLGASEREAPAVLCGDMNAWPDSDSMRYLRGRTVLSPATLWTDAWDHPLDQTDNGATSTGENPYARHTALTMREGRDAVLDATLLPERRIDFIYSRGWRHGRMFTPTRTRVVRSPLMSDHYAVVSDLILE